MYFLVHPCTYQKGMYFMIYPYSDVWFFLQTDFPPTIAIAIGNGNGNGNGNDEGIQQARKLQATLVRNYY